MPDLMKYLNQRRPLLPTVVTASLVKEFTGKCAMCVSAAVRQLLVWCVQSMPDMADDPHVRECQVLDSLQHYRFGFHQAQSLISAFGVTSFDNEMVGLFTIIHDIGRLMVGSGASKPRYPSHRQGDILHPIVGAIMLREAFQPLRGRVASEVRELLNSLIYTVERHTLSIGLMATTLQNCGLARLEIPPYQGHRSSLLLIDAPMAPAFAQYAHLVALADLINNVSETLNGVVAYRPVHFIPSDVAGRIDYVINSSDLGDFEVRLTEGGEWRTVHRLWKCGVHISSKNFQTVRDRMKQAAIRFASCDEQCRAISAFQRGFDRAFPHH